MRALHDVVVRDDVPAAVDDEARSERADLFLAAGVKNVGGTTWVTVSLITTTAGESSR